MAYAPTRLIKISKQPQNQQFFHQSRYHDYQNGELRRSRFAKSITCVQNAIPLKPDNNRRISRRGALFAPCKPCKQTYPQSRRSFINWRSHHCDDQIGGLRRSRFAKIDYLRSKCNALIIPETLKSYTIAEIPRKS